MSNELDILDKGNKDIFYNQPRNGIPYKLKFFDDTAGLNVKLSDELSVPLVTTSFDLKLIQPGHAAVDKKMAEHVCKLCVTLGEGDQEFFDELYAVPICVVSRSFRKFAAYMGGNSENSLICWSSNGLTPSPRMTVAPTSERCAVVEVRGGRTRLVPVCPDAIWNNDRMPHCTCNQYVRVAFLLIDKCIPVTMQLKSTGLGAFNKLLRERNTVANVARIRRKDLSRFVVKISGENRGNYSALNFAFVEAPEEYTNLGAYSEIARYYRDNLFSTVTEDEPVDAPDLSEPKPETESESEPEQQSVKPSETEDLDF